MSFRPLIRGLSISSPHCQAGAEVSPRFRPLIRGLSISSSLLRCSRLRGAVSVPSSGDYQFLRHECSVRLRHCRVSVPSSGDYQFLLGGVILGYYAKEFPSPHPGIINFFLTTCFRQLRKLSFRPLIRGLSISSRHRMQEAAEDCVSVPSSGDYQFLLN